MIIEQNTNYAYKLKYMDNPTFDKVRNLSTKFYRELPLALQDELFEALNRGIDILDSEPQMTAYLFAFGKMHQAKLNYAFDKLPKEFLEQPEINIIDYGCGQALGTMCYADFLRENGYAQNVKAITLIEPSEICLKRAALHVSKFCPDAEIVTVNKEFDYLADEDIARDEDTPTLHIFSNVLDLDFDLGNFAQVISDNIKGYNQFVCVGPYFNKPSVDHLMDDFAGFFEGKDSFNKIFDKYQLNPEKSWTAHIRCFSVGELEEELTTEVTNEEIENGIKDEYGVVYSKDGKRLLRCRNSELREYTIKNGTRVICDSAFSSCESLQQITIPDSVTSIGSNPFQKCHKLTLKSKSSRFIVIEEGLLIDNQLDNIISYVGKAQYVTIPDSVTSIGDSAFYECQSLQQITIPDSVTSIGYRAFWGCESLQQITIPDSVTSIGYRAFSSCKSLRQITIPDSVTSIGNLAFSFCKSLQQITIPDSVTSIGNLAFSGCKSLQQITIPDSVTSIGNSAFSGCKSLQQITIPDSVTSIGNWAFSFCKSLQQITIPDSVTSIGSNPFRECHKLTLKSKSSRFIVTEEGLLIDNQLDNIISYVGKAQYVTIPDSVTSIGDLAFYGCRSLRQITIPDSVTSIGNSAFSSCESLRQITIPDSVTSIGNDAFSSCESLRQITIPDSVTSIGNDAFYECQSLRQITIPDSVTSIGNWAFWGCKSLQQITIPDSVTSIGNGAFSSCKSLRQITIPDSVTSIGDGAFSSCKSLQQITIPDSVTSIGNDAFYECQSLRQITIPDSVTSIGNWAFSFCESLQQIIIPKGSMEKFKQLLPTELWDKLYYLEKADVNAEDMDDGLPF